MSESIVSVSRHTASEAVLAADPVDGRAIGDGATGSPHHLAIIMDGNHRWAKGRRLPGAAGHRAGARRVRPVAEACSYNFV